MSRLRPSGLGQEVLSPGDDEYADAEEHSATTDLEMKRYIVRYGTYGTFADTGTHKYDDAWFEDPAPLSDIKWTYGTCRTNQTIFCGSSAFAYVDPFPSIGSGQKGKKCQYIGVSQIPDIHKNASINFVPARRASRPKLHQCRRQSRIASRQWRWKHSAHD